MISPKTKLMGKLFYTLVIGFLPMLSFSQDQSSHQTEVMMKMASLRNALLNKDSAGLSNLLADDVSYGHSNGMIQTKAELIRDVVSGVQDYRSIDPSDMNVRIFGNSGIVNLKAKVKLLSAGTPMDLNLAMVLVWIKKEKDWKLEARQAVKQ